ncbi:unnamed protein product, partial [Schistosoma mattheei]
MSNNTNYNDTLFNISSLSTIHQINTHSHNAVLSSEIPSKLMILHHQLKYHIIEFVPHRKYHRGRIYCQILIRMKKDTINKIDSMVSETSSVASLRSWRNQIYDVHDDIEDDSVDDPVMISSMGHIDLNI